MRKLMIFFGVGAMVLSGVAYAEHRDIDLKDYDDDLMHDVDRALKFFEPDVTAKNISNALEDASTIHDGFIYSKGYFTKKSNADDAVKIAQDGLDLVDSIVIAVNSNDFPKAITLARQVPNTCKACHEIYKPRNK